MLVEVRGHYLTRFEMIFYDVDMLGVTDRIVGILLLVVEHHDISVVEARLPPREQGSQVAFSVFGHLFRCRLAGKIAERHRVVAVSCFPEPAAKL